MPRTAPTIDGTPLYKMVSLSLIDVSGDLRAISNMFLPTVTAAQIEAWVAGYALETNANIYAVRVTDEYAAVALASDAIQAPQNSVTHNIVVLLKNNVKESEEMFLVAPNRTNFVGDTDNPDPASINSALLFEPLVFGGKVIASYRYTDRTQKNAAVKA